MLLEMTQLCNGHHDGLLFGSEFDIPWVIYESIAPVHLFPEPGTRNGGADHVIDKFQMTG